MKAIIYAASKINYQDNGYWNAFLAIILKNSFNRKII